MTLVRWKVLTAGGWRNYWSCPMGQASIWLYLAAYGMGTKAFGENGAGFLSMKSIIGYKRQGIPGGWWRCIPLDIPSACRIALPECAWKKTSWNRMWGLRVPVPFHPFCILLWQNGVSDWIWHCRSALAGNYKNAGYILFWFSIKSGNGCCSDGIKNVPEELGCLLWQSDFRHIFSCLFLFISFSS